MVTSSYSPLTRSAEVAVAPAAPPHAAAPWFGGFLAGFGGWTLDAFDFFLVVLSLTAIGKEFGQDIKHMTLALTATLALRPVGALLFGGLSDRFGRRIPLVVNLCLFAVVELATGFARSFSEFLLIRAVFGIVMGGQWGVGVSLAMEKVPGKYRGVLSGLLQQGYAIGFLLASAAYFFLPQANGWRSLFYLGSVPALALALFVLVRVEESAIWRENRSSSLMGLGKALVSQWKLFVYLTFFMMAMHMSSHGTQDMYPTFLEKEWGVVGRQKATLSAVSMIGAILGGLSVGWLSDRIGRRWSIIGSLLAAVLVIPLWAHAHTLGSLVLGAVLMQFFVQGAWGVVPAHVAELSPDSVRATLPGLGNQIGVLLSSTVVYLEAALAKETTFATSMSMTAAVVLLLAAVLTFAGQERRASDLTANAP
jgi:MFS transporter, SHS family, lactate transporter